MVDGEEDRRVCVLRLLDDMDPALLFCFSAKRAKVGRRRGEAFYNFRPG